MDAGQLVADGPVHQGRDHRRVHPAGQGAEYPIRAHPGADLGYGLVDERVHGPVRLAVAQTEDEVAQHVGADQGVGHLRVELDGHERHVRVAHGRAGRVRTGGGDREPGGQLLDPVAVAHPHLVVRGRGLHAGEQAAGVVDLQLRRAELALLRLLHPAAQLHGHQLRAVTDAEHRHAQVEEARVAERRVRVVDAGRAAGEDDARGLHGPEPVEFQGVGVDLAVHLLLADAAGDELGGLRAEIKDDDLLGVGRHGLPVSA